MNDPRIVELLRTKFVPVAIDNVDNPQWTAAEKAFLADRGGNACTQGMTVFTAGGTVLARGGGYEPDGVLKMLQGALAKFEPGREPARLDLPAPDPADKSVIRRPPEGGLVLYVTWKVLGGYDKPQSSATTGDGHYDETFRRSIGVDRLWVRKDEAEALARGELPRGLLARMARHVADVTGADAAPGDLTLRDGNVSGTFFSAAGESPAAFGRVESREGRVTRLAVIVRGQGRRKADDGFSAALTVVPQGVKVPVAMLFELADPADELSRVPPHRAREEGYLK